VEYARSLESRSGVAVFVIFRIDPSHHAKATNIVEVDGLEPEKLKSEKSTQ
jgi:hypothetical protein